MGLYSMYTGFIYNDVFSKSVNIFGTSWSVNYNVSTVMTNKDLQLNPTYDYYGYPYPIGVDPIWQVMFSICVGCISLLNSRPSV
jgi:V-type H+-transporting ATPase subunit a